MHSGWLFTYLSKQMVQVSSASFRSLQAKPFCFEKSRLVSSLAGMYEVKWRRRTSQWHSPLGFSCYKSSSSCLSERFRIVESAPVKESPVRLDHGKTIKIDFSLICFNRQRHNSACQKLTWVCLTKIRTIGGQTIWKCLSRWGTGCFGTVMCTDKNNRIFPILKASSIN